MKSFRALSAALPQFTGFYQCSTQNVLLTERSATVTDNYGSRITTSHTHNHTETDYPGVI